MITKEQIIEILYKNAGFVDRSRWDQAVHENNFNDVAEEILSKLHQPPVSGMLKCCSCGYEYEELIIAKDGNMKCKDCAF